LIRKRKTKSELWSRRNQKRDSGRVPAEKRLKKKERNCAFIWVLFA
jgi:hypothetical protein